MLQIKKPQYKQNPYEETNNKLKNTKPSHQNK